MVPPAAGTLAVAGLIPNVHGAASCVTTTTTLLTVMLAWRGVRSMLEATLYATDPSPCPLVLDVSVIHAAPADADHVQSRVVAIVSAPVAPAAGAVGIELLTST